MKNSVLILLVLAVNFTVQAQRTIEKTVPYNNQQIIIKLDFATHIEIKTWEKPRLSLSADLTTEEGKYLDLFAITVSDKDSEIHLKSDALPVFEAFQEENKKQHPPGQNANYTITPPEYVFNYTIYVPRDAKVKLSSISGDLHSENIEGDFTADLISGDINISNYTGNLDLKTISGDIDLKMNNTSLVAETLQGNIYADKKLNFTASDKMIGQKITGKTASATNTLKLNTINGDLFLRY